MTVSDLFEQPCNKSDNAIKFVTSCSQLDHAVCSIIDMTKHSIYLSLYIVGEREKERAVNDSIEMGEEHPLKDAEV